MKLKNIFIKKSQKKKNLTTQNFRQKVTKDQPLANLDLLTIKNFMKSLILSQNLKIYNSSQTYIQSICQVMSKFFEIQSLIYLTYASNEVTIKTFDTLNMQQNNIVLEGNDKFKLFEYLDQNSEKNELKILNQQTFDYLKPTLNLDRTMFYQLKNNLPTKNNILKSYVIVQFKEEILRDQTELQNLQFFSFFSLIDAFAGIMFGYLFFDMFLFKNLKYYTFDFLQQFFCQIQKKVQKQQIESNQCQDEMKNNILQNSFQFFKENQQKNNKLKDKSNQQKMINSSDFNTIRKYIFCLQQKLDKWKIYDQIKHVSLIVLNKNRNVEYINQINIKIQKNKIEQKIQQNISLKLNEILQIDNFTKEIEFTIEKMIKEKTMYFQNHTVGYSVEIIVNMMTGQIENYVIQVPLQTLKQYEQKNLKFIQQNQNNVQIAKTTFEKKVVRNQKRRQVNFNQQFQPQIKIDINPSYRIKSSKQSINQKAESMQLIENSFVKPNEFEKTTNFRKNPIKSFSIISQHSIISNLNDLKEDTLSKFESLNLDFQKLEYQRSIVMEFMPRIDDTCLDIEQYESQQSLQKQENIDLNQQQLASNRTFKNFEQLQQRIQENPYIVNDWNIDINAKDTNFIISLLLEIFDPYVNLFNINKQKFCNFLLKVQDIYEKNQNPFHNFYHGVSVCYSAQYFVKNCDFIKNNLSDLKIFGFLLAALCHDLGHTGFNNTYEINCKSEIALTYLDQSPLEHHHCSQFFRLIQQEQSDIFMSLDKCQIQEVKRFIIDLIISTDMQKHFDLLDNIEKINKGMKDSLSDKDINLAMKYLLHCCDLAHTTKNSQIAEKLAKLINQEFSNQYKNEKINNLPLTQHFRELDNLQTFYQSEINFITVIVEPLFEQVQQLLQCKQNNFDFLLKQIKINKDYYQQKLEYYSMNN